MSNGNDKARAVNEERVKSYSKKRLLENITKKFKTSMIGAVASCEEGFGELWGHGKGKDELTEEEFNFRERWEEIRTQILNKGNSQLRGALDEIAQHTVNKEKYNVDFIVRKEQ
jgi:hypothetical protein